MARLEAMDVGVLVLDTLHHHKKYVSHLSLEQSLAIVERVRPRKTLLIGMSHDFDHDKDNAELAKLRQSKGLDVQLAHDGLKVDLHDIPL